MSVIRIQLGFAVKPLAEQVAAYGLELPDALSWEDRHAAWNLLRFNGLLSEQEAVRVAQRIERGVRSSARRARAEALIAEEIRACKEALIQFAEEGEPVPGEELPKEDGIWSYDASRDPAGAPVARLSEEPAPIDALGAYLAERGVPFVPEDTVAGSSDDPL